MSTPTRWAGLSGVLAAGVVVLTVLVVVAELVASGRGAPGPGTAAVLAHGAAAVVVVTAQVWADRRGGRAASGVGVAVVFTVSAVLLWNQWWA